MVILEIRMIAFLTLAVLAPGCSCEEFSCKCVSKDSCELIRQLLKNRTDRKNEIKQLSDNNTSTKHRIDNITNETAGIVTNISKLNGTVTQLSEDVRKEFQEFHENTSSSFKETNDKRNNLRKSMKKSRRETEEQIKDLDQRLTNLETRMSEMSKEFVNQIQRVNKTVAELSNTILEATNSLNEQEIKSKKLQSKMNNMKSTVSSLIKSQSELKEEFRTNLSSSIERLKMNVEDRLIELKFLGGNLTAKIKQTGECQLLLEWKLSKCAPIDNLSDLDRAVREHARTSSLEHQSLRSEMSGLVTELRKQFATRGDIDSLSTRLNNTQTELQQFKNKQSNCKNIISNAMCKKHVDQHQCTKADVRKNCCASCAKA